VATEKNKQIEHKYEQIKIQKPVNV